MCHFWLCGSLCKFVSNFVFPSLQSTCSKEFWTIRFSVAFSLQQRCCKFLLSSLVQLPSVCMKEGCQFEIGASRWRSGQGQCQSNSSSMSYTEWVSSTRATLDVLAETGTSLPNVSMVTTLTHMMSKSRKSECRFPWDMRVLAPSNFGRMG